jgi:butyrate kinase
MRKYFVVPIRWGRTLTAHQNGASRRHAWAAVRSFRAYAHRALCARTFGLLETHSLDEVRLSCSRAGGFDSLFGPQMDKCTRCEQGEPKPYWYGHEDLSDLKCSVRSLVWKARSSHPAHGGLLRFDVSHEGIRKRCGWIAPIAVYPAR